MCNECQEIAKARVAFSHIAHFHKNIGKMPHNDGYGNPTILGNCDFCKNAILDPNL